MNEKIKAENVSSNIDRIDIFKFDIELTHPTKIAIGSIKSAMNVAVKITSETGEFGWGEASPFPPITGDSQASNFECAKIAAEQIKGKDALAINSRMREIERVTFGEPSIRSAFDMALYDLAAKEAGMPLFQYLGGEQRHISTDLTIGQQASVDETVKKAQAILDKGFDAIKLKVGRSGLEDVAHVSAVRELAGPDVAIKIDSNQGWDYPTAVANLRAMASLNLQYSEQPLAAWDSRNLNRLRSAVDLPICLDESVFNHRDALRLLIADAADYFNIKLAKSGGINTALKIDDIAESAGKKCMIGCFAETRLALSAAAHLAMARPNIEFLDLDSAYKHKQDPVLGGMNYSNFGGQITLPNSPGHGASFDEDFFESSHTITIF